MSQTQRLPAEANIPAANPTIIPDRPLNGPRVADHVDSPIASPVHLLQDKLQRLDDPDDDGGETAYPYKASKAPAWVRLALPVTLSVALWVGILYVVGLMIEPDPLFKGLTI